MQKSAFERTGLVPRSIIRTFDRFRRQLLPGAEDLVIQEFRVSKYQVLVSVRCLASLLFFPLLVNYLVKTTILIPLAEYIWNTQQSEIFLNFYQENRAFLEMRDFEEKTFFESLVSGEQKQSDYETLVLHKTQNNFNLIPIKSPKILTLHPAEKNDSTENLNLSQTFKEKGTFIRKKSPQIFKKTLFLENLTSQNNIENCDNKSMVAPPQSSEGSMAYGNCRVAAMLPSEDCDAKMHFRTATISFNYTPNLKDSFFNLPPKKGLSDFLPTELKELNSKFYQVSSLPSIGDFAEQNVDQTNKINLKELNSSLKSKFGKISSNFLSFCEGKAKLSKPENFTKFHFLKQSLPRVELNQEKNLCYFENKKVKSFSKIDDILLQKKFQEKTIQLAIFYNQQTISAIANVFGDFVTLITIAFLFVLMKPQIIILKSFLTESIYSLSDTTKSFLLILLTDLLVGFHSPRGWEIIIEILLRHFGLPENQDFVFLFVATLPVLLDTVFKYWIFRYLNQISPSTVATYHSMIE